MYKHFLLMVGFVCITALVLVRPVGGSLCGLYNRNGRLGENGNLYHSIRTASGNFV